MQPDNARVQVGLAECKEGLGETAEAVRLVDEVLVQKPDFPPALSLRGQLAFGQGQFEAAVDWSPSGEPQPGRHERARYNLALALERSGHADEGQQYMREFKQMQQDRTRFNEIVLTEIAKRLNRPGFALRSPGQILF